MSLDGFMVAFEPQTVGFEYLRVKRHPLTVEFDGPRVALDALAVGLDCPRVECDAQRVKRHRSRLKLDLPTVVPRSPCAGIASRRWPRVPYDCGPPHVACAGKSGTTFR